jgi:hypothetical protein
MTQSEIEALEDGQTLWWLHPNLEKVQEATFVESETPSHMRRWDDGFRIKPKGEGMLFIRYDEVHATREDAYETGFARIARMIEVANKKFDNALARRARLILSENAALRRERQ